MSRKEPAKDNQNRAFRKAARDLRCEDNEDRFKAALRMVGKAKPKPESRPSKKLARD